MQLMISPLYRPNLAKFSGGDLAWPIALFLPVLEKRVLDRTNGPSTLLAQFHALVLSPAVDTLQFPTVIDPGHFLLSGGPEIYEFGPGAVTELGLVLSFQEFRRVLAFLVILIEFGLVALVAGVA